MVDVDVVIVVVIDGVVVDQVTAVVEVVVVVVVVVKVVGPYQPIRFVDKDVLPKCSSEPSPKWRVNSPNRRYNGTTFPKNSQRGVQRIDQEVQQPDQR